MQGAAGAIQTGGDTGGNLEGNLPTQAPLALFSGVVRLDDQGRATVTFDLPAFNGSVRLAAVAWSKTKVGSAEADVIVRDPIVVSATLPRFLDVGDRSADACRDRQRRGRGRRLHARPRHSRTADGGRRRDAQDPASRGASAPGGGDADRRGRRRRGRSRSEADRARRPTRRSISSSGSNPARPTSIAAA